MSADDGLAAIETILGTLDYEQVVLSATPLGPRVAKWTSFHNAAAESDHEIATGNDAKQRKDRRPTRDCAGQPDLISGVVLKAYAKVIGPRDLALDANFFELGGDSLLAAQLAMELRGALPRGNKVSIGEIFDYPTPRRLAQRLACG